MKTTTKHTSSGPARPGVLIKFISGCFVLAVGIWLWPTPSVATVPEPTQQPQERQTRKTHLSSRVRLMSRRAVSTSLSTRLVLDISTESKDD